MLRTSRHVTIKSDAIKLESKIHSYESELKDFRVELENFRDEYSDTVNKLSLQLAAIKKSIKYFHIVFFILIISFLITLLIIV